MDRAFIVDFDGTITREDVSDAMVANFCRPGYATIAQDWSMGKISTRECGEQLVALMDIPENDLLKWVYGIEVDSTFEEFRLYCEEARDIIWIISDGYDFYIEPILKKHGWGELPYFSNIFTYKNDKIKLDFPYEKEGCLKCGNCKSSWIDKIRETGRQIILIGDGFSDICAADKADVVFGKKQLLKFCRQNNITCHEYNNFNDIVNILTGLDNRKKNAVK